MKNSDKNASYLHLKTITWYKDSHSLFDYESSKVVSGSFDFQSSQKTICVYRKRDSKIIINIVRFLSNSCITNISL